MKIPDVPGMVGDNRTQLVFGEFSLDPGRRRLYRAGDRSAVTLSPKTIDALIFLVEHRDAVIGKEALLGALWPNAIVEENSLAQTISALRRGLGERRGENRYIATVPGRGYRFVAEVTARAADSRRTLAVLPFAPLVVADRNESLEFGMTETLVASLGALSGISVCPMSSVRRYAGGDRDPLAAGRELDAEHVLEGSLQHHAGRLRVSARLLRVADARQVWAGKFDEAFTTVFDLQDAIARKVTQALSGAFAGNPGARIVRRDTRDAEAYRLYASGRLAWSRLTEAAIEQAIDYFRAAIARDPQYARAYSGLAECYGVLAVFQIRAPMRAFPESRSAAIRAIELDPTLAEAYVALGHVKTQFENDWAGGEHCYARAIELDPGCCLAHLYLGILLGYRGRFDHALAEIRHAQDLEPMWPAPKTAAGMTLYFARRYLDAIAELEQILAVEPHWDMARSFLGRACLQTGTPDRALAEFRSCRMPTPGSAADVGTALAALDRRTEATAELGRLAKLATTRYVSAYDIATIHASLGDTDGALHRIEDAFAERATLTGWLAHDPAFDGLRVNPRFSAVVDRLGGGAGSRAPAR